MAYCVRVIVFLLLVIFTAAGTCSLLFPLFRKEENDVKYQVFFWYREVITHTKTLDSVERINNKQIECKKAKDFYTASAALAVAGTGLGGLATFVSFGYLFVRRSCCMALMLVILTFLSFACFTADVGMIASSYTQDACKDMPMYNKLKDQDLDIVEAFGLMCAAAGGYLIIFVLSFCA
ncbi:Amastin surface glycoprotein, putative [Angomonas deanei]|uniref:Amastin surface glycoprotein, putative n=1 Tax=Angomonas deanei TaxID=59799 RepID=A0A7G2C1R5_9TRYP|nr:Amastin surface glycoprotein, putative [Angomonas deanei]